MMRVYPTAEEVFFSLGHPSLLLCCLGLDVERIHLPTVASLSAAELTEELVLAYRKMSVSPEVWCFFK